MEYAEAEYADAEAEYADAEALILWPPNVKNWLSGKALDAG